MSIRMRQLLEEYRNIFLKMEKEKEEYRKKHGRDPMNFVAFPCPACRDAKGVRIEKVREEEQVLECTCSCGHEWETDYVSLGDVLERD